MERHTYRKIIFVVFVSLFFVQSCALIGSQIDDTCAEQFVNRYPSQQESRFALPWQIGEGYELTQGNCSSDSHTLSDNQHMAFDFRMPIGTPIHAVDDGRISFVIEEFRDHVDNDFAEANVIGIEHDGGFLSLYAHLTYAGSLVQVDDVVSRGDLIGYSGNTGLSAYPHLHFVVQQIVEVCFDAETHIANLGLCPQFPISFSNANPSDRILQERVTYTAMPY